MKVLLEHGADANVKLLDGRSPISYAMYMRVDEKMSIDMISVLLEHGADINDRFEKRNTVLLHPINTPRPDLDWIKNLLERKADPNLEGANNSTPLIVAIQNRSLEVVKLLLDHGARIEATTSSIHPLRTAIGQNDTPMVAFLLKRGADIRWRDRSKETFLHTAAQLGHIEIASRLLAKGVPIESVNAEGATPLHLATQKGKLETVRFLLDKDAKVNSEDASGHTPLYYAATNTRDGMMTKLLIERGGKRGPTQREVTRIFKSFGTRTREKWPETKAGLEQWPALVKARDQANYTLLHRAAERGFAEGVELLIRLGADVNAKTEPDKLLYNQRNLSRRQKQSKGLLWRPIHMSVLGGNTKVVDLLLAHGADINACNRDKNTPLHLATSKGGVPIVQHLLEKGASLNPRNVAGESPLARARMQMRKEIVALLKSRGGRVMATPDEIQGAFRVAADNRWERLATLITKNPFLADARNDLGNSLLHLSAFSGNDPVVALLLKNGADPNAKSGTAMMPLHFAAAGGQATTIALLLEAGGNLEGRGANGRSPLLEASLTGQLEMVKLLFSHKAMLSDRDFSGNSALHLAAEAGQLELAKYLLANGLKRGQKNKAGLTAYDLASKWRNKGLIALLKPGEEPQ